MWFDLSNLRSLLPSKMYMYYWLNSRRGDYDKLRGGYGAFHGLNNTWIMLNV